jgi:hypothetical protein
MRTQIVRILDDPPKERLPGLERNDEHGAVGRLGVANSDFTALHGHLDAVAVATTAGTLVPRDA